MTIDPQILTFLSFVLIHFAGAAYFAGTVSAKLEGIRARLEILERSLTFPGAAE